MAERNPGSPSDGPAGGPGRTSLRHLVVRGDPTEAASCLAAASGLSKGAVKGAMAKGAVHVSRGGGPLRRLHRVKAAVRPGDVLEIHYDPALLALRSPQARLLRDAGRWSAWVKPAGLLVQGTLFGDHASLLRQVEKALARPAFLVHRLDREVEGLVLVAHDQAAAAALSALFREGGIEKRYRAEVIGDVAEERGGEGSIDLPVDEKSARTFYRVVSYDPARDVTALDVRIETGRHHQIRRHLEAIGHPVVGDPRYGAGNKNREGMRLEAVFLAFHEPFSGEDVELRLPEEPPGAESTSPT